MNPEVAGNLVPLYEMLGMTADDAKRITGDFAQLLVSCNGIEDLCHRIVEKYGIEAVAMSICLRMTFEVLDLKKSGLDANVQMLRPSNN